MGVRLDPEEFPEIYAKASKDHPDAPPKQDTRELGAERMRTALTARDNPGEWVLIATFETPNSAQLFKNRFKKRLRRLEVTSDIVEEWETQVKRELGYANVYVRVAGSPPG